MKLIEVIEPDFEMHRGPAPMAVFKLLPRTNCRQCGQATCFTFALKVAAGQQKLDLWANPDL